MSRSTRASSSEADDPLGRHAINALTDHRARVAKSGADDLVFANQKGLPFRESKLLTRVLQPAAIEAVDESHRAAVTAVEERLFGVMLRNAPKSADGLASVEAASDSVN